MGVRHAVHYAGATGGMGPGQGFATAYRLLAGDDRRSRAAHQGLAFPRRVVEFDSMIFDSGGCP